MGKRRQEPRSTQGAQGALNYWMELTLRPGSIPGVFRNSTTPVLDILLAGMFIRVSLVSGLPDGASGGFPLVGSQEQLECGRTSRNDLSLCGGIRFGDDGGSGAGFPIKLKDRQTPIPDRPDDKGLRL